MLVSHESEISRSVNERNELLERAFAQREAWAYEAAYLQFGSRLYSCAIRVLRNTEIAQECVHDVMFRLWRRGDAYTPKRGALEAFLVTCVRNDALARVRDGKRRREIDRRIEVEFAAAGEPTVDDDPIERAHLRTLVESLAPAQTRAIDMAYYRGMTHVEIAAELEEPVGTIKSRLSSALRALRLALAKENGS
jgi:RNA polymerase sigma-70 factor (ECF subfamily)